MLLKKGNFKNKLHLLLRMDLLDRKILCMLDENCRFSYSQIAKKLRTNRNVIAYRINRLEKAAVGKYICAVNLGFLNFQTYRIYLKINITNDENSFRTFLLQEKAVIHAIKMEGAFDYALAVAVQSVVELDLILMRMRSLFPQFVNTYTVSNLVYTKIFKIKKLLLVNK